MSKRLKGIAWRYMLTSWLSLSRGVALLALVSMLLLTCATRDTGWLLSAGIAGGALLLAQLVFFIESAGVRCFGCGGTLLSGMRCSKHWSAKRTLGSYTLTTTLALSVRGKPVHCPYCGMSCNMFRPGVSSYDSAGNLELTTGGRRPTVPSRPGPQAKPDSAAGDKERPAGELQGGNLGY